MKSVFAILLCLFAAVSAFQAPAPRISVQPSATALHVFGNKKSTSSLPEADKKDKYWQGEWVCKDCGYIYNRVSREAAH